VDFAAYILGLLHGALSVAEVVLIFSILVIGHEYGHFLVAKAFRMRIDEFAIGFGKRLLSWRRGETVYSINLIPVGGYNKIYGMEVIDPEEEARKAAEARSKGTKVALPDSSIAPRDDPRAFVNRPVYQRFCVVLAGSVANILIAVLVVFLMGVTIGFPAAELGGVIPGGPAEGSGLMAGDIITNLDGVRLASTADLHQAVALSDGRALHLKGTRGNQVFSATVIPQPIRLVDTHFCRLGFVYLNDGTVLYLIPSSPAERSGLIPGDIIISVDGLRFPSHRLEIESGSGMLRLRLYRGYQKVNGFVDYFDDEIVRDSYSPFGYFCDGELVVTRVIPGGIADEAGLKAGDRILGGGMETWTSTVAGEPAQAPKVTTLEYERSGKIRHARLAPDPPFSRIQVYMDDAANPVLVRLPYDHRLYQSGLRTGDRILSIAGIPTPNGISAFLEFERHIGKRVSLVALSGGEERVFVVPIPSEKDTDGLNAFFGGLKFETKYFRADPLSSMVTGLKKTKEITGFIFVTIRMLTTGQASVGDLSGPVGIATFTYEAASSGLVDLINIMVLLSVNLAIFNLLPFPALDGGRLLFMFFEFVFRRPVVTVRMENLIHFAGFALLMLLALFVTYHDIARLILGR